MRIGKYRIVKNIGRGGMGIVYKGLDLVLQRPVAIKVLGREFSQSSSFVGLFEKEAEASSKLSHPCIAAIYDVETDKDNSYLVMEYIDGKTLRKLINEQGKFQFSEAIEIIEQIASALDYAHGRGIIHRDVKPENIIIVSKSGSVKVTDFGLAVAFESSYSPAGGKLCGTPAYMPPEQICGGEAGFSSDIYSLAIVAYEMLEGRLPFASETPLGITYQHVYDLPLPAVTLPLEVETVLFKAMNSLPEQRYDSGMAFVKALDEAYKRHRTFLSVLCRKVSFRKLAERIGIPAVALCVVMSIGFVDSREILLGAVAPEVKSISVVYEDAREAIDENMTGDGSGEQRKKTGKQEISGGVLRGTLAGYVQSVSQTEEILKHIANEGHFCLRNGRCRMAREKYTFLLDTKFNEKARLWLRKVVKKEKVLYTAACSYEKEGRYGKAMKILSNISHGKWVVEEKIRDMGFVFVPGGEFVRRSPRGKISKVKLEDYYIGMYEVTNEEYKNFVAGYEFPEGQEDYPVTGVNWYEACLYAEWAGLYLPTESEWEKAAFGCDGRKYPWGNTFDNYRCNTGMRFSACRVGSYPAGVSPCGAFDMVGNVWEWVRNCGDSGVQWRVMCGASWNETVVDGSLRIRASLGAEERRTNVGFRCCWRVPEVHPHTAPPQTNFMGTPEEGEGIEEGNFPGQFHGYPGGGIPPLSLLP